MEQFDKEQFLKNEEKRIEKLNIFLKEISEHNKKIYEETPKNEKIDFSKGKKDWGSDVIPKELWINIEAFNKGDIPLKLKTIDGWEVIPGTLELKLFNSSDEEVTFPIKGSIRKEGKRKAGYCIWTLDGRNSNTEKYGEKNSKDLIFY